jgi:hypothetical protein
MCECDKVLKLLAYPTAFSGLSLHIQINRSETVSALNLEVDSKSTVKLNPLNSFFLSYSVL